MKIRSSATTIIATYLLLILLCFTLWTYGSKNKTRSMSAENIQNERKMEKKSTAHSALKFKLAFFTLKQKIKNKFKPKFKIFEKLINKNINFEMTTYLNVKEILMLRRTCKKFKELLQPGEGMLILYYTTENEAITLPLNWFDLKFFLDEGYGTLNSMEIFKVKTDQYAAILSKNNKIISWHHDSKSYPHLLFNSAQKHILSSSLDHWAIDLHDINRKYTYMRAINNPHVRIYQSTSSRKDEIFPKLENAKLILSNDDAHVGFWEKGKVLAWGKEYWGGMLPHPINAKMIFSNTSAFAALLENKEVLVWGSFLNNEQLNHPELKNVKMIVSANYAFAALLENGKVFAWGMAELGGKIPDDIKPKLENVKMIFANSFSFLALLNNGDVVSWGNFNFPFESRNIPPEIQSQLKNVKAIATTNRAYAALLSNGEVLVWGSPCCGGEIQIPLKNVKMIFSNKNAFIVLFDDEQVFAWGDKKFGGKIPDEIQDELKNVKTVFSCEKGFAVLLHDGRIFMWGDNINLVGFDSTKNEQYDLISQFRSLYPVFPTKYKFLPY